MNNIVYYGNFLYLPSLNRIGMNENTVCDVLMLENESIFWFVKLYLDVDLVVDKSSQLGAQIKEWIKDEMDDRTIITVCTHRLLYNIEPELLMDNVQKAINNAYSLGRKHGKNDKIKEILDCLAIKKNTNYEIL